ncbi:hypothetical protein PROPEN_00540 [Proteus penneri ATCC 35198]|nr:hypothetical protein PROPEN_00540 [Proteus penneri ATCC 35198]
MRFYRTLTPIAAMTFDLDDTLYDNVPVMDKTEKKRRWILFVNMICVLIILQNTMWMPTKSHF